MLERDDQRHNRRCIRMKNHSLASCRVLLYGVLRIEKLDFAKTDQDPRAKVENV